MILPRHASALGRTELAWIRARHHFRFAAAQSVDLLNWQRVRTINHNTLSAKAATTSAIHYGTEVIYIVEDGSIDLVADSGIGTRVAAGQILSIYTGSGIHFSIANPGAQDAVYAEIWLTCDAPHEAAVVRRLGQVRTRETHVIAAARGSIAPFGLNCSATVTRHFLARGETAEIVTTAEHAYAFLQTGTLTHQGTRFSEFDGMAIEGAQSIVVSSESDCGLVLIEMF